jgi:hypothetical protein
VGLSDRAVSPGGETEHCSLAVPSAVMYDEVGDPSKLTSVGHPWSSLTACRNRRRDEKTARYRQRRPTAQQERHDHTVPDTHFGSILQFPILDKTQGWGDNKYGRLIGPASRRLVSALQLLLASCSSALGVPAKRHSLAVWQRDSPTYPPSFPISTACNEPCADGEFVARKYK